MLPMIQYFPPRFIQICILLWITDFGYSQSGYQVTSLKNCSNYIYIGVESNINQFSFLYNSLYPAHNRDQVRTEDTGYLEISIPIRDFEASNPLMYNDFLKLLKAKEYPRLKICISNYQLEIAWRDRDVPLPNNIQITLAGISRTYEIGCTLDNCDKNLYISGAAKIKLSDFDISPPAKFNGLVKVRDEISVNFGLMITIAENNSSIALH